jgi:hypothetical protein
MEEKSALLPNTQEHINAPAPNETMARKSKKARLQMAALVILFSFFWLARTFTCGHEHLEVDTKVPLDVHIMSKCPDARDCLKKLILPAMANVSDKVDFRLSMIGKYVVSTSRASTRRQTILTDV